MREVSEQAPAKINLHLRIVARAADGYHDLETIFQALELHDTLDARIADTTTLTVHGDVDTGPAADNLVLRAARAFRDARPDAPHAAFTLTKRIPSGAGLGGGSSDAAAALRALNRLGGSVLDADELRALGATLGADVAFFMCGSPLAAATGRGEVLSPWETLPATDVLVVDPGFAVATRDAFAWWDAAAQPGPAVALTPVRTFAALRATAANDFEHAVFPRHPELGRIRDALLALGADLAMLSGSGSCVYGLFENGAPVEEARALIRDIVPAAQVLHTRTRS